jgi:predicted ATPase/class 3 adenylate cyclase
MMRDPHFKQLLLRLNMAHYSILRQQNETDWDAPPDLSDKDLERLGIPRGYRKNLLRALAALRVGGNVPYPNMAGLSDTALPPLAPSDQDRGRHSQHRDSLGFPLCETPGERRQITVMFCDMVGSTQLSRRLDPEDLREIIHSYQRCCAEIVERFGGYISQYLGDGILAYFGYPQARENDAERAVRAGLDIVASIGSHEDCVRKEKSVEVAIRIGIATGLVVVGDPFGSREVDDAKAFGETPNLAARLQAFAPPNTIAVSTTTHDLLEDRFEFVTLGSQSLPGIAEPCPIWRVVRPADAEERFEATHRRRMVPLVGRERELARIADHWQTALKDDGQVVLVSGEPGIGKSSLVCAFEAQLGGTPHHRMRFFCSPFFDNSPLHPIIEHLERVAGFTAEDGSSARRAKLTALLNESSLCSDDVLSLLLDLLGISSNDAPISADFTPQKRREMTLQALLRILMDPAKSIPTVIVFEDIQWIDPTTNELLHRIVDCLPGHPAMLIATFRPEFRPAWLDEPHVSLITLGRLGRGPTEELIASVAGRSKYSPDFVAKIVERTDGIPLFVEELTKALLHREKLTSATQGQFDAGVMRRPIPATLHASLLARLDQLPLCKEIAQVGSVIGRKFSYSLISSVTNIPDLVIQDALSQLIETGIILCRGEPPVATYIFKHALVQDAAYQSLLQSQRRRLHHRIAKSIESGLEGMHPSREILAHHFTEAGEIDCAITNWLRAAETASAHSAYREAINNLQKGLSLLNTNRDAHGHKAQELELLIALGAALIALRGVGSSEVEAVYARAIKLCADLPESRLHFTVNWNWWRISMDLRTGRQRADALLALAQRLDQTALIMQAHHALWATLFNLGDQRACLEHIECGLKLYAETDHRACSSVHGGHDARVCGKGEAALSLWLLGYPTRAAERIDSALMSARKLKQPSSLAHAIDIAITLSRYRRDVEAVAERSTELLEIAETKGFPDYIAKAKLFGAWAKSVMGEPGTAFDDMISAMTTLRCIGTREDFPIYLEMVAEVCDGLGRKKEALDHLNEALALSDTYSIGYWTAELHRKKGLVLLGSRGAPGEEAEPCLLAALETAGAQNARMLELRAAQSLAQLYRQRKQVAEARSVLLPVLEWFCEGSDELDLQEARTLALALH